MLLIVHKSERLARPVADMFRYMDILAYHTKPADALTEISTLYRAVLILNPEDLPDAQSFVGKLRRYAADIPIFATTARPELGTYTELFTKVYPDDVYASRLAEDMMRVMAEASLPILGTYMLCGLDLSFYRAEGTYLGSPLSFTRTELRILRFLIRTYPLRVSASDILKYTFSPQRLPELSGIRTHISAINRKFRSLSGGQNLIDLTPHEGYRILAPTPKEKEAVLT